MLTHYIHALGQVCKFALRCIKKYIGLVPKWAFLFLFFVCYAIFFKWGYCPANHRAGKTCFFIILKWTAMLFCQFWKIFNTIHVTAQWFRYFWRFTIFHCKCRSVHNFQAELYLHNNLLWVRLFFYNLDCMWIFLQKLLRGLTEFC